VWPPYTCLGFPTHEKLAPPLPLWIRNELTLCWHVALPGGSSNWSPALSGRTFPRRGTARTLHAVARRRIAAELDPQMTIGGGGVACIGRSTPPSVAGAPAPRSHSRSYGDLHRDDQLRTTQPLPPPPLLDLDEPRPSHGRTPRATSSALPRGGAGAHRADASRTLDRLRSNTNTNPTDDVTTTPRDCVVDCSPRLTGYPVCDV